MKPYGEFEERGYKVQAFLPQTLSDRNWTVKVFKDGDLIKEIKIPMHIEPRFGVDSIDLRILEAETAKLMKSLP